MARRSLTGTTIGAYRILSLLGAGGMGEVYTARDQHLDRNVAVKVLPEAFTHDRERIERFRREAQLLAALNHPNIATIHGLEESDGVLYLVMELVPGQTLAERIARGRVPLDETLRICGQLAEALGAAHHRSIAHRDIKPANIKVTPDGRVKILDFGLAKSADDVRTMDASDEAPTVAVTVSGVVLGTPAYMTPEQVRGEPGSTRSDLWAFGCVLYELLSGRRAFSAPTVAETIAAVLMSEPDWNALPPDTPTSIRGFLRRCLDKDAQGRVHDITDVQSAIETARHRGPETHTPSERRRSIRSLAVLPFANVSGDPQMDYLGDGLTESIILSLSRLPQLKVTAQSSVFRYKGQSERALEIGRTLGVEAVLTGRVLQRGNALQISVELADVEGWRMWGAQYRRNAADIFAAEEEITREISENLRLTLSREETQILARRQTGSVEAYHLYLKGRFYWAKRTEDGLAKSMQYFREALERDPTYALAYAGLAEAYVPQGYYCHVASTEAFPRARAAAERALEIDSELSEARSVIAAIRAYEGDLAGAEQEARAAIAASPNYPRARQVLAECLTVQGRFDEAVSEMKRGLDLDPLALYMNAAVVMTYYFTRQFDAAITHGQPAIDMDPSFYPGHLYLGLAYQQTGRGSEAIASLERASSLSRRSTLTVAALGAALASDGRTGEATDLLRELDDTAKRGRYVSGVWVAAVHTAFGDTERALSSLEQARQDRCCWLMRCLKLDARFDRLRAQPRFIALSKDVANEQGRRNV